MSSTLPVLNSLWVGDRLGFIERLCIQSALACGHSFRLFSYEPDELAGVPDGVELLDAAEVMPRDKLVSYSDTGAVALGTNFWRYELLAKGLGCWTDMDMLFVRPMDFDAQYIFGWEHEGWLNNALLLAPADSPFVHDLLTIPQPNRRPPWFGPRRTLLYYFERLKRGHMGLEDMPWGTYSAGLVTYLVKKHGLDRFTSPPEVFYPVRWKDARMLYGPADEVEALVTERTVAVHMWHSRLGDLKKSPPPQGSYVQKMADSLGVEF